MCVYIYIYIRTHMHIRASIRGLHSRRREAPARGAIHGRPPMSRYTEPRGAGRACEYILHT